MFSSKLPCALCIAVLTIGFAAAPTQAQNRNANGQGTAGNLIAALNNINVQTGDITVIDGDVLRNVNVVALNNALNRNNIELLSGADADLLDLDVQDVLNDLLIDLDVNVNDVVLLVDVLSGRLVGIILL